jgi:Mrp family chromosome partitioning ATPase
MVDAAVLVVRPDKNRRRLVIRAAEAFAAVDANLMGVVVNHLSGDTSGDYYSYGYGYGYGYGYEYGYGHDDQGTETDDEGLTESESAEEPDGKLRRAA